MRRLVLVLGVAMLLLLVGCGRRRVVVVNGGGGGGAVVQTFGGAPNFGYVNLPSGFMPDPQVAGGRAGGQYQAASLGGNCRGFISMNPDHVVQTGTGFQFFRVFVRSNIDTTLVIRDPQGQIYCNDDGGGGLNPMIENTYWMPGNYEIWVGTYNSRDYGAPHQIYFTELPHVM